MKVFLVDDEKGIVEGLKVMFELYIPECEVVGVAYNGIDGYKLIQEEQPDIVISDIRMPEADGLEMIQMLKDTGCQSKFIILSGYADFEYARKGIQLGVQFYLNKPVEEEELCECMRQVMEGVRADRIKLEEMNKLKQEAQNRLLENTLRDLLDAGNDDVFDVEELLKIAGIPTSGIRFIGVLLEFDSKLGKLRDFGIETVFRHIDRAMNLYRRVYRFRYTGSQVAVIVTYEMSIDPGELIHVLHRLKNDVYQEMKLFMSVGIGTQKDQATGISLSFEEARQALSYKVIKGAGAVIQYSEIKSLTGRRHVVQEETINKLEAYMDNMDEEGCVGLVRGIFRKMKVVEREMSPTDLQLQCLNILLSTVRKMSFEQVQQNDFLGRNILSLEGISRFSTMESLQEWMIHVIREIIALKQEQNKKKDIISEIKEYVIEHYNESLSLAELSARFFLNPYYLSQLFKQKTGDTYLNFLAQIRINKSKELLVKTDLPMYEICHMVGYSDTQHFTRVFEKLTGVKPREYRKSSPYS